MHPANKPPKKKKRSPEGPPNPKDIRPETREQPASAERTEAEPENVKETRATPDTTTSARQPVTNQDEQDRITNAEQDRPVPEN